MLNKHNSNKLIDIIDLDNEVDIISEIIKGDKMKIYFCDGCAKKLNTCYEYIRKDDKTEYQFCSECKKKIEKFIDSMNKN